MPLIDPSDLELNAIRALVNFAGQRVVEIGAGDGRLAGPFAARAAQWLALDAEIEDVIAAAAEPGGQALRLLVADGRALSLASGAFDIAFFTWSLC